MEQKCIGKKHELKGRETHERDGQVWAEAALLSGKVRPGEMGVFRVGGDYIVAARRVSRSAFVTGQSSKQKGKGKIAYLR
jgi:hypothetical protein